MPRYNIICTDSVIRDIVEVEISKLYTSLICSSISLTFIPLTYNETITFYNPSIFCLFGTIIGLKKAFSVSRNLNLWSAKRGFYFFIEKTIPIIRCDLFLCFSYPKCTSNSLFKTASKPHICNWAGKPFRSLPVLNCFKNSPDNKSSLFLRLFKI